MCCVDILVVPYDSANRAVRMGAGPHALLRQGLEARLRGEGIASRLFEIEPEQAFHAEIATAFELHDLVRAGVRRAMAEGRIPLTLSGNCNTGVVGSLAAHDVDDVGLFWFDAHSDAETPESSASGFLDGMGLAVALGECWKPKLEELGWRGLNGRRVALVGAREVSSAARALLARRGVAVIAPETARLEAPPAVLAGAVEQLRSAGARRVHVHVDLDVLDPDLVGPANTYALPGGLTVEQLLALLCVILEEFDLASASVASYDPSLDPHGNVASAGLEVICALAGRK